MKKYAAFFLGAALLAPLSASAAPGGFVVPVPKPPGQCITIAPSYACAPTVWVDLRDVRSFRFVVQSNAFPNPPVNLVLKYDGGCLGERCATVTIASSPPSLTGAVPLYPSEIISIPQSQRQLNTRLWLAIDGPAGTPNPPMLWAQPLVQFYR